MLGCAPSEFSRSREQSSQDLIFLFIGQQKQALFTGPGVGTFAIHDCDWDGMEIVLRQLKEDERPCVRVLEGT